MKTFDAIIIGSGQGGTPLSKKLAKAGYKTAIIEKRFVGGTCVNDGCTPTKAMIASAKIAYDISQSAALGVENNGFEVDFKNVIERKNNIVHSFRDAAERGLEETENLTLIFGEARFTGNKTISVLSTGGDTEEYRAERYYINTGTVPNIPKIDGLEDIPYLTSTTLMDIDALPGHLVILGGGYVAVEFAQMFKRFGSEVTIIAKEPFLIPREDHDVSIAVCEFLEKEGIKVYKSATSEKFSRTDSSISVEATADGVPVKVSGSHLLLATGRDPATKSLGLENTGVLLDEKGHIKVNEYLETAAAGIFAIGDVKGGPAFTHISYNDHLVILKNLLEHANISIKGRQVPYTMFTDPQLGRIGLSEREAKELGLNIKVAKISMDKVARAIETGQTTGFMKAIVDADTRQILGAAILGPEGGEVMTVLQMAMMGKITYQQIRENIFAHPLYSESLNNLFIPLDK